MDALSSHESVDEATPSGPPGPPGSAGPPGLSRTPSPGGDAEASDSAPPQTTRRPSILTPLRSLISVDLRALALLRVLLALLTAGSLLIVALDTWNGLLPFEADDDVQPALIEQADALLSAPQMLVLAMIGTVGALLLLVGYRSRAMAALCLAALLAVREATLPAILLSGETLLILLLFWAIFLPVGARFGLDSVVNTLPIRTDRHASLPALLLIVSLIAFNLAPAIGSVSNLPPDISAALTRTSANAGAAASASSMASAAGEPFTVTGMHLASLPWLPRTIPPLVDLSVLVALVLLCVPLLQGWPRAVAAAVMAGLHLLIALIFTSSLLAFALTVAWVALLPPVLWDALFVRLRTPQRVGLTIWYHRDHPAHLRRVKLLATFLLVPETALRPSRENVDIDVYRRQRDSWVVTDDEGYRYNRFRGFAAVCRASPLAFPIAPILQASVVETVGDWFYDFGKRYRGPLTRIADALSSRPVPTRLPLWQQLLAVPLFALLVWWLI